MYFKKIFIMLIVYTLAVFNFYIMKVNADDIFKSWDSLDSKMRIVQWNRDESAKKITWLIDSDGYRRLIKDESTLNCLKNNVGLKEPHLVSASTLDKYFYTENSLVVCGAKNMDLNNQLVVGTYIEHTNGAKLILTHNGLFATSSRGQKRWAPVGKGNRFILQEDQDLVLYKGNEVVWSSNTKNSGANRLWIEDTGFFVLYNQNEDIVWSSDVQFNNYRGKIIYWEGDITGHKILWLVGIDGKRHWVDGEGMYGCLQNAGFKQTYPVSGEILNHFPEFDEVEVKCPRPSF